MSLKLAAWISGDGAQGRTTSVSWSIVVRTQRRIRRAAHRLQSLQSVGLTRERQTLHGAVGVNDRFRCTPQRRYAATLLSNLLAQTAKLSGEIFKLREPVTHWQNGLSVVDMHAWAKRQRRQRGGVNIDQPQQRMVGH